MADLTYPNRVNTQGFPSLNAVPSIADGNLVLTFQPHLSLGAEWSGAFLVNIAGTIATGNQPVVFVTSGEQGSTPLYNYDGAQTTAANIVTNGGGIIICFYNHQTNKLQIIGSII